MAKWSVLSVSIIRLGLYNVILQFSPCHRVKDFMIQGGVFAFEL